MFCFVGIYLFGYIWQLRLLTLLRLGPSRHYTRPLLCDLSTPLGLWRSHWLPLWQGPFSLWSNSSTPHWAIMASHSAIHTCLVSPHLMALGLNCSGRKEKGRKENERGRGKGRSLITLLNVVYILLIIECFLGEEMICICQGSSKKQNQ